MTEDAWDTARNLSPRTNSYYRNRLVAFRRYLVGEGLAVTPSQITPKIIRDFIAAEKQRVSDITARHSFVALRAFMNFLVQEQIINISPLQKMLPPKTRHKIIPTFTVEQVGAMLHVCNDISAYTSPYLCRNLYS